MAETRLLGHQRQGEGPVRVFVLNDWLCDTSTWDGAHVYLDEARFSWVFADLRGYGRSRGHHGAFTAAEGAADVLALADALGWSRFSVVGHSMSTYVAMHLGQHDANRIERLVLITPPPPRGFGADEAGVAAARAVAGDEERRGAMVKERFAERLSPGWGAYKSRRFVETSDPEASAGYVAMFARDGLATPDAPIAAPVLAITGEQDMPAMRKDATLGQLSPLCASLEVVGLAESGHYPMQEMPPLTVSLLERFLVGLPPLPALNAAR